MNLRNACPGSPISSSLTLYVLLCLPDIGPLGLAPLVLVGFFATPSWYKWRAAPADFPMFLRSTTFGGTVGGDSHDPIQGVVVLTLYPAC